PSLHHRKEGWLRHQENFAQPPKLTQPGWFSFCSYRKTTPASRSAEASQSFFDRSATPPCGDARRGIALFQFFHSSIDRPYSQSIFFRWAKPRIVRWAKRTNHQLLINFQFSAGPFGGAMTRPALNQDRDDLLFERVAKIVADTFVR